MSKQGQSGSNLGNSAENTPNYFTVLALENLAIACMPACKIVNVTSAVSSDFVLSLRALKNMSTLQDLVIDFSSATRVTSEIAQELKPLLDRCFKENKSITIVGANEAVQNYMKQYYYCDVNFVESYRSAKEVNANNALAYDFLTLKFGYYQLSHPSAPLRYPHNVRDATFKIVYDKTRDALEVKFYGNSVDPQQIISEINCYPLGLAVVLDLTKMSRLLQEDVADLMILIKSVRSSCQNPQIIVAQESMAHKKLQQLRLAKMYNISTVES